MLLNLFFPSISIPIVILVSYSIDKRKTTTTTTTTTMPQGTPHKLFYKGKENDFVLFIDDVELLAKYKKETDTNGSSTVPIIDVVSIFKVFVNRQRGVDGILDEASKLDLLNDFGTSNIDQVIKIILDKGDDKSGTHAIGDRTASKNDANGAGDSGN